MGFIIPFCTCAATLLLLLIASLTIQPEQEGFGWIALAIFLLLISTRKYHGLFLRVITFVLGAFIGLRYIMFRGFFTLQVEDPVGFWVGLMLFGAEVYCIILYLLNLFVNVQQISRPPAPLPQKLPTIDVLIPTYDEDEDVAYTTALACKNFDYPPELVNIYILNDGSRLPRLNTPSLQDKLLKRHARLSELAARAGVHYLTRKDGQKAKAGMLNAAILGNAFSHISLGEDGKYKGGERVETSGDLLLILDCDHIPTKDMLKSVVGHFDNENLFLVQTPHFMINPDPLRKNTGAASTTPCESWLFYQGTQCGLDRWGASFFCGSAAFIRRSMILQTHGLCGDTITEDAETALNLHAKGFDSVYVDKPMVAGLAPESFDAMINQRIRWCQGMIQILLLKNPLFRRGLTIAQRLCYMNNCLYWLFPIPRVIFVLAPLMFLFFNMNVYNASGGQVLNFAGPYLISSSVLFVYIFGKKRVFLQSEISEMMQSFFLLPAIFSVFISPKKPAFATTPKGIKSDEDAPSPRAKVFLCFFAIVTFGFFRALYLWFYDPLVREAIGLTMFWNVYNFFILICCLGVVWERKQQRAQHRFITRSNASLNLYAGRLQDLSASGFVLSLGLHELKVGDLVTYKSEGFICVAKIVRVAGASVAGEFIEPDPQALLGHVYGSSDNWRLAMDEVLKGQGSYAKDSFSLIRHAFQSSSRCIAMLLRSIVRYFMVFVLCLLWATSAQAETITASLKSLLFINEYTLTGEHGELRVPFYLSERSNINSVTLTLAYSRSDAAKSTPLEITATLDEKIVVGTVGEGKEGTTVIFDLPKNKLIPGDRTLLIDINQFFEVRKKHTPQTHWTNIDLANSYLTINYTLKPMGNKSRDLEFIFDDRVIVPKELAVVMEKYDEEHIKRALRSVQNIAIRLVNRPLYITVLQEIPPNKDCLLVGDLLEKSRPQDNPGNMYALLTEADLGGALPSRRTILGMGSSLTFKEIGMGNVTFYAYSAPRSRQFVIPSAMRLTPNRKLRMSLNLAYGPGMPADASLAVYVNKEMFARIRLDNEDGELTRSYKVDVPSSLLTNGVNTLVLEPSLSDGAAGNGTRDAEKELYATVFASSSISLPDTGVHVHIPELRSLLTDGYPFKGDSRLYLDEATPVTVGAALNLGALIAQKRGSVGKDVQVAIGPWQSTDAATQGSVTYLSTNSTIPAGTFEITGQILPNTRGKIALLFTANKQEDLYKGMVSLWKESIQPQIFGTKVDINLATGAVTQFAGPTVVISEVPPLPALAYFTSNYPQYATAIFFLCILLASSMLWGCLKLRRIG